MLNSRLICTAIVFNLSLGISGTGAAQTSPVKSRVWAGAALGYGVLNFSCQQCASSGVSGAPHLLLRAGTALRPSLLLGIEFNVWKRGTSEDQAFQLGPVAYWYPARRGPVFVKWGFGLSRFRRAYSGDNPDEVGSGVAFIAGLGIDFKIGQKTLFVPTLTITDERIGDIDLAGLPSRTHVHSTLAAIGLGIRWH